MVEIPALTRAQMIEVDRLMGEDFGFALLQMMENAGRSLAALAQQMLGGRVKQHRISVLCGPGNNGGGGMVAARHLHNMGAQITVVLAAERERLKSAAARQWAILKMIGLDHPQADLEASALILDALLGYGSQDDPHSPIKGWIERANAARIPILALDSPSGLDTTTGRPGEPCMRATVTMTLALPKTGLLAPQARPYVGQLYLADIGVPPELYAAPALGLSVGPLFTEGPIVRLDSNTHV